MCGNGDPRTSGQEKRFFEHTRAQAMTNEDLRMLALLEEVAGDCGYEIGCDPTDEPRVRYRATVWLGADAVVASGETLRDASIAVMRATLFEAEDLAADARERAAELQQTIERIEPIIPEWGNFDA